MIDEEYDVLHDKFLTMPIQTAAWKIFHCGWQIGVQRINIHTQVELENFGLSHGEDIDGPGFLNEWQTVRWPISEIARLMDMSINIKIVHRPDTLAMYEIVREHLINAKESYTGSLRGTHKPPINDLKVLDRFNETIYPLATEFMFGTEAATSFEKYLRGVGKRNIVSNRFLTDAGLSEEQRKHFIYQSPIVGIQSHHDNIRSKGALWE